MKRLLYVILSVFILLSAVTSCGNGGTVDNSTVSENNDKHEESSVIESVLYPAPDLLAKDYGGITFNVICNDASSQNGNFPYSELGPKEETGEILNDAIFRRNLALEEKYNIDIICTELANASDVSTKIQTSVLANDDVYDIASCIISRAVSLASQGHLFPLNDFIYVDLDAPWWLPHLIESTSIGGTVYLTPGYSNITFFDSIGALYFNKTVLSELDLESPYKMIENNEWTIDNFISMCKDVTMDFDGDGEYTEKDMYGFMTNNSSWSQFYYSTGNHILTKDNNDIPVIDFINEKSVSMIEKIITFVNDTDTAYLVEKLTGWPEAAGQQQRRDLPYNALLENRTLFVADLIYSIRYFRNMQADFGVIPPPKNDENQEKYISYVHPTHPTVTIIPVTNSKLELTDVFLEDLMYMSYESVKPVYFETALNQKFVRDDESVRMLEYIFDGAFIDIGLSMTSIDNDMRVLMANNSFEIQSTYDKSEPTNLKNINDLIKAFTELD